MLLLFPVQQNGGLFPTQGSYSQGRRCSTTSASPCMKTRRSPLPARSKAGKTRRVAGQNGEVSQREGYSQNGSRGRHNVSHAGRGGKSPQAQMPHRDPGKTFVFCGLFFPSHLPKSVLCQMLIPGIMHHVFINCTCRATSLPIALTCKSRGHLRSTSRQLPRPGTSVPVRAAHPLGNRLFQNPNGQLPLLPS